MNYIKVTYGVGNSFIKSTFEDNSTYVKTSVNSTFIKVAYDGGEAGLDAERLRTKVYNMTGGTLVKGTVVYINGSHGNLPSVAKAIATSDATSAQTMGLVLADITDNKSGYIILAGKLSDLDTQAIPNGSQLYLSATIAGGYTATKQYAPNHLVYIGVVNRSHPTQGEIEVRIANGYEADEIHDFAVRNPSNNDGIFFNSATSLWEKKQVSAALGYTPVPTSRTITINGVSYDLSADRAYTIAAGISGSGTSGQVAFWNGASSLTGVNGLFWDNANSRLGIGTTTPSYNLHVYSSIGIQSGGFLTTIGTGVGNVLTFGQATNIGRYFSLYTDAADVNFTSAVDTTGRMTLAPKGNSVLKVYGATGNVLIQNGGTFSDDGINRLQVSGSAKFTSDILVNGINIGLGAGNVASNLRFGGNALISNTSGAGNVALGYAAMYYNTGGSNNMAIGVQALVGNSTGDNNVAVGTAALFNNTNGYNNVAIGHWAGYDSVGTLGNSVGANNIFIGYGCLGESGTESNRTWIGNASTTSTWVGGRLLVGTRTDNGTDRVQIGGTLKVTSYASFGVAGNSFIFDASGVRTDRTGLGVIRDGVNYNFYVSPTYGQSPSGTYNIISTPTNYQPTSGTAIYNTFLINATVNQTGGANGITRGLYVAPTLTNAFDWRAIEWSNNSGWGLYGAGTANNYLGGNLLLGSTTPSGERLQVTGNVKIVGSGATSATTALTVQNSSSTNLLFVRNDGRVGINTNNPEVTFDVRGASAGIFLFRNAPEEAFINIKTGTTASSTGVELRGLANQKGFRFCDSTNANNNYMQLWSSGNLTLETNTSASYSDVVSALLQVNSTTKGFLPPRMTTTQKNAISSPAAGLVVYDTTLAKLCVYTTAWETITST